MRNYKVAPVPERLRTPLESVFHASDSRQAMLCIPLHSLISQRPRFLLKPGMAWL